jgi:uncharacterized RDD family membrane protein YckC/DNA-directed RNA polymerase subunit M/transcription elongation factor TFIIS
MPIKVRCKQCSTVLTVSDKARGRAVKCRECGGRVQVGSRAKKPQRTEPTDPDDLFGGLNLAAAEDAKQKICPSCAQPAAADEEICSNCGVHLQSGQLGERERIRRKRKGPPPEEFYKAAIRDGLAFVKGNKGWCLTTALVWSLTTTMALCSAFTLTWYIDGRASELRESGSGNVEITEEYVLIDLSKNPDDDEAMYDGKRYTKSSVGEDHTLRLPGPQMGAMQSPPSMFWIIIFFVSVLGFGGWAWTLAVEIAKITLQRKRELDRFHTDLFSSMAMGFRSIFWPAVLLWPFLAIPIVIHQVAGSATGGAIAWACIFLLPTVFLLPVAIIHLTQKYTYRAWLLNWMAKDWFNTALPSLFVSALFVGLVLSLPLIGGGLMVAYYDSITSYYTSSIETSILASAIEYQAVDAPTFFAFTFLRLPLVAMLGFVGSLVVWGVISFPAVFMMRVFGTFGYYFRPDLSLINEQTEMEPAGFGPRFLAGLIDCIMLVVMAGVSLVIATMITKLFGGLYGFPAYQKFVAQMILGGLMTAALWAIYFSSWESGQNRGTLGKVAVGLMVMTDKGKPVTSKQALQRAAAGVVTCLTLFIGFAMCAFHDERRALHDILSKTKVVWRGESEE